MQDGLNRYFLNANDLATSQKKQLIIIAFLMFFIPKFDFFFIKYSIFER